MAENLIRDGVANALESTLQSAAGVVTRVEAARAALAAVEAELLPLSVQARRLRMALYGLDGEFNKSVSQANADNSARIDQIRQQTP
jgi:hypothetical protein